MISLALFLFLFVLTVSPTSVATKKEATEGLITLAYCRIKMVV